MINSSLRVARSQAVLVLVLMLGLAAAGAITLLERHVDASRQSRSQIAAVELDLISLVNAPLATAPGGGGSISAAVEKIEADRRSISGRLRILMAVSSPPPALVRVPAALRDAEGLLQGISRLGAGSRSRSLPTRRELPAILTAVSGLQVKVSAVLS